MINPGFAVALDETRVYARNLEGSGGSFGYADPAAGIGYAYITSLRDALSTYFAVAFAISWGSVLAVIAGSLVAAMLAANPRTNSSRSSQSVYS